MYNFNNFQEISSVKNFVPLFTTMETLIGKVKQKKLTKNFARVQF